MKRLALIGLFAGLLIGGFAGTAQAATCNITLSAPLSNAQVRGTVAIFWIYSGGCEQAQNNGAKIEIVRTDTTLLANVGLGTSSINWDTTTFSDGGATTVRVSPTGTMPGSARTATGITVDNTNPVISAASMSPAPNQNGWNTDPVTVTWGCSDATSPVVATSVSQTISTQGADQLASGTCTDLAGNSATAFSTVSIDSVVPTIRLSSKSPAANESGWNNTSVGVSWACDDALSGPVSPSVFQTVSTEGADQLVEASCEDLAGNSASDSATVSIDLTGPTLSVVSDQAGCEAPSWCAADAVDVVTLARDDLSGLALDPSGTDSITSEGIAPLAKRAVDLAGNEASASLDIQIDRQAPTLTLEVSPDECANGAWCNADEATVTVSATSGPSGLLEDPSGTYPADAEGLTELFFSASSNAGLESEDSVEIRLDRISPVSSVDQPGMVVGPVAVDVAITPLSKWITGSVLEDGSGAAETRVTFVPAVGGSAQTLTAEYLTDGTWRVEIDTLGPNRYTVTAATTDAAGNTGDTSTPISVIVL